MIIDCHGHYTTSPRQHEGWRNEQIEARTAGKPPPPRPTITDDEIRQSIEGGQLKVQRERGTDLTIFSPRAAGMGHHLGDATTSEAWASACNDLTRRVPPAVSQVRTANWPAGTSRSSAETGPGAILHRGTEGSNPLPSSKESIANFIPRHNSSGSSAKPPDRAVCAEAIRLVLLRPGR